jgi:hypothetical protein
LVAWALTFRKASKGDLSPTSQIWPKGSVNPPCLWIPQGLSWSLISSRLPFAPARRASAMKASGESQNTSTQAMPNFNGVSQPFPAGSPNKNGAPATSRAATPPRLHSSTAPRARLYHSTAAGTSETASITDSAKRLFSSDTLLTMLSAPVRCCEARCRLRQRCTPASRACLTIICGCCASSDRIDQAPCANGAAAQSNRPPRNLLYGTARCRTGFAPELPT